MLRTIVIATLLMLPVAGPASAQSVPDTDNGRYSLTPVDSGFLRLDQRTGQVSVCSRRDLGWSCHPVPDERSALEDEIARLQKDNAGLKKDMLARGLSLPGGQPAKPKDQSKSEPASPADADIDRALATAERIWRRLVEMIARLQRDIFTQI